MKIIENFNVPTGNILIVEGEKGKLEMLSIGDYGQAVNLNQNKEVPSGLPIMPLTKKWVITISTQYGCSMNCKFCNVPKVGRGINATFDDLIYQVLTGMSIHPEIKYTERLNIHYARMGEPTFNHNVLTSAMWLTWLKFNLDNRFKIHPVVSTMMPNNNKHLIYFLKEWMRIKNEVYDGDAGLQLSINSTDEQERNIMFSGHSLTLEETSSITKNLIPKGRKITLNFAIANYTINPEILLKYFNPDYFICKLTPMHKTKEALHNNIKTEGNYTQPEPYREVEYNLNKAGYETLIFIASNDEDLGRITCGNALLSGTRPFD